PARRTGGDRRGLGEMFRGFQRARSPAVPPVVPAGGHTDGGGEGRLRSGEEDVHVVAEADRAADAGTTREEADAHADPAGACFATGARIAADFGRRERGRAGGTRARIARGGRDIRVRGCGGSAASFHWP